MKPRGATLVELLFVVAVAALLAAITLPRALADLDRMRAAAAARFLAQQCRLARFQAVARGRFVALRFRAAGPDHAMQLFVDGNRDGVGTADIEAGVDTPASPPQYLSVAFPGVRIALDPAVGLGTDAVRLGGSDLLSFSPEGTATAGSVYVLGRDGTQLAVRVLGATGRTRVQRFERSTGAWMPL